MSRTTIAKEWSEFAQMVLPKDAPPVQRQEMRRAFFAGFTAMLAVCRSFEESEADEACVDYLQSLWLEAKNFSRSVEEGRA